ncbi:MAG TPA: glycoside hydrolase family 16 protein [Terriglobales bacterium]|jgi:beta-glucanase (GH16 family)
MRNWIGLALIALLLTVVPLFGAPPPSGPRASGHWQLVWSSEFNGPAGAPPPAAQWTYDRGNRRGWGNNELENYCAPEDHADPCSARPNIYQDGHGHLVIQARRDAAGRWTSGRLKTQGLYQTSFGRIEARMKLPLGAGLWPAFWLLGTGPGGWPAEGEIDIMEHVPQLGSGTIQSTIHAADFFGGHGLHGQATLPKGATVASGFHTYGVIWKPGSIQFYLDHPAHPFVTLTPPTPQSSWPFDDSATDPFEILLNLAVGGNWPGPPGATTPPTAKLLVDYVRVYKNGQTGTSTL